MWKFLLGGSFSSFLTSSWRYWQRCRLCLSGIKCLRCLRLICLARYLACRYTLINHASLQNFDLQRYNDIICNFWSMGYFVSRLSAITYAVLEKFVFIDFGCLFVVDNIKIRLIKTAPVPGIFLSRVGRRSEGSHVRALGLSHSVQCDVCVGGGACPPS
jgi:hypothetical protein